MKRFEPPTNDPSVRLQRLVRRFRNAQRRARYWSGTPSFSVGARAKATKSGRMDEQYELAMCDQDSLAGLIANLGGSVKVRDYKAEFRGRYMKWMAKASNAEALPQAGRKETL